MGLFWSRGNVRGLNSPNAAGRVQDQSLKFFSGAGGCRPQPHCVQLCCLTFLQEKEVAFGGLETSGCPFIPKPRYGGFCAWLKLLEGLNASGCPQHLACGAEGGRRAAVCVAVPLENAFSQPCRVKSAPTADPVHLGTELEPPVRLHTWGGSVGTRGRAECPRAPLRVNPSIRRGDPRPTTGPGAWPGGGEQPQMPLAKLGMEPYGGWGAVFLSHTWLGKASMGLSRILCPQHPPSSHPWGPRRGGMGMAGMGMAGMGWHRALLAGISKATSHNDLKYNKIK